MSRKAKKMTDYELVSECRYQSSRASGSETAADELTESRTQALKYYLGRPRGDEVDGNSQIISMDVADTVHAMLAEAAPIFSNDTTALFEAESEEDEKQAKEESDICNYTVMEKNNGFVLFQTMFKDCCLSKNCVSKVYVDEYETVETEEYKDLNEIEMFEKLQTYNQNQFIDVLKLDEEKGILKLKRITQKKYLKIQAVAPENFATSTNLTSPYIQETDYCRERFFRSRSDLIKDGYDSKLVAQLPRATSDTKVDSVERNQVQDEQNFHNNQEAMQLCEIEEHYIRIDYDGDGIAELRKVVTCENHLLEEEEVPCIPYATGVIVLMGHRFYGLSVYDLLKNIQDGKTAFLRQWIDNAVAGNHKKFKVIEDDTNMEDAMNGRSNGFIRVKHQDALQEMPTNDIGPSCNMALDYLDKVRAERSGSALDLQTNQIKTPHNVGDQGVQALVSNLEQITALCIKTFAETYINQLYLLVHKYLKKYFKDDMSAKIGGGWRQSNPARWLDREQINITVGLTKTERVVQQVAIEKIIIKQEQYLMQGLEGQICDRQGFYTALLDHARMSGINNPEKYWVDPDSDQAKQAQQAQEEGQMQQMQQQADLNNRLLETQIAEIQRNAINDKEELEFRYAELEQKYEDMRLKYETEEAKIVGKATADLEKAQLEIINGRNADNERQAQAEDREAGETA